VSPASSGSGVVIVGGSAGGTSTADALRARGYQGRITLVGDEVHGPYDRPPLSKQILHGTMEPAELTLRPAAHFEDIGVEVRRGVRAVAVNPLQRRVMLGDGDSLSFEQLVIATGVSPRRLPGGQAEGRVHVLRSVDDALVLRAALRHARRVVVVGGGVLGAEVAASVSSLGLEVVIASPAGMPLQAALGETLSRQLMRLHGDHGVRVRTGTDGAVASMRPADNAVTVEFETGSCERADLVVVAIGSEPAVSWLAASGIPVADGVLCAQDCSAGPGIYAVGDVARWYNTRFETSMRIEHRTNATEQAWHVADRIVAGDRLPYRPVPYFWTDQYGLKVQAHGYLRGHDAVQVVHGDLAQSRLVALFRRGDVLTGVVTVGAAKAARTWCARIQEGTLWRDALALV
jgi:NADPH-dependent 2,4-dienoyl-CoA reductase/sulfur reductase-like enzyme